MIDPVSVSSQTERLLGVEVENLDSFVDGTRCQEAALKMNRQHAVGVALECAQDLAGVPVPDLDCLVETPEASSPLEVSFT